MATTPPLPRTTCTPARKVRQQVVNRASTPQRSARVAGRNIHDTFSSERQLPRSGLGTGACKLPPVAALTGAGTPRCVTFPTHTEINRRLVDEKLWPPRVDSKTIATLSYRCNALIVRESGKTYDIPGAAQAIARVLAPVKQMMNVEQMRVMQVLMANAFVPDEALRASVKAELRDHCDPAKQ